MSVNWKFEFFFLRFNPPKNLSLRASVKWVFLLQLPNKKVVVTVCHALKNIKKKEKRTKNKISEKL